MYVAYKFLSQGVKELVDADGHIEEFQVQV